MCMPGDARIGHRASWSIFSAIFLGDKASHWAWRLASPSDPPDSVLTVMGIRVLCDPSWLFSHGFCWPVQSLCLWNKPLVIWMVCLATRRWIVIMVYGLSPCKSAYQVGAEFGLKTPQFPLFFSSFHLSMNAWSYVRGCHHYGYSDYFCIFPSHHVVNVLSHSCLAVMT